MTTERAGIPTDTKQLSDEGFSQVDSNQLENALLNLCINARDAMADGGTLSIRTGNCAPAASAAAERDRTGCLLTNPAHATRSPNGLSGDPMGVLGS